MNDVVKKSLDGTFAARERQLFPCGMTRFPNTDSRVRRHHFCIERVKRVDQRGDKGLAKPSYRQRPEVELKPINPANHLFREANIQDTLYRGQIMLQCAGSCFLRSERGRAAWRAKLDTHAMDEVVHTSSVLVIDFL